MQTQLDKLYCLFLSVGFIVLREASAAGDLRWAASEIEFLHEVPNLIGETRPGPHEYFWFKERPSYIESVMASKHEMQISSMRTYYEPIWKEMEPLILALCQKK